MGRKIFVSYKYSDTDVYPLPGVRQTTPRDYVDKIQEQLQYGDHIYKGEEDDEDLSNRSDDYIWGKLKDKIYDSSITIVLISPNMKESNRRDRSQWIPWEISYSLKEITRINRTSQSNAVFAVILPNRNSSCEYFVIEKNDRKTYFTESLFNIHRNNMFNEKNPTIIQQSDGAKIYQNPEPSYIFAVKWFDFISNIQGNIDRAVKLKLNINKYNICKEV